MLWAQKHIVKSHFLRHGRMMRLRYFCRSLFCVQKIPRSRSAPAEQEVYMCSVLPKKIQNKRRGYGRILSARPPAEPPFLLEKLEEMLKETEKNG